MIKSNPNSAHLKMTTQEENLFDMYISSIISIPEYMEVDFIIYDPETMHVEFMDVEMMDGDKLTHPQVIEDNRNENVNVVIEDVTNVQYKKDEDSFFKISELEESFNNTSFFGDERIEEVNPEVNGVPDENKEMLEVINVVIDALDQHALNRLALDESALHKLAKDERVLYEIDVENIENFDFANFKVSKEIFSIGKKTENENSLPLSTKRITKTPSKYNEYVLKNKKIKKNY